MQYLLWQPRLTFVSHPEKLRRLQPCSPVNSTGERLFPSGLSLLPSTGCLSSSVGTSSPQLLSLVLCCPELEAGPAARSQAAFLHWEQWKVCVCKRLWLLRNTITIDQAEMEMCALSSAFHAGIVTCRIH